MRDAHPPFIVYSSSSDEKIDFPGNTLANLRCLSFARLLPRMCSPMRTWERPMDRCFRIFPCLADPGSSLWFLRKQRRRSSLCLKVALVTIHLVYAGVLFLFDGDLIEKTKKEPCYVLDAMMTVHDRNVAYKKAPDTSR
ncbi:hypothetical protein V8G54_017097 [Vigna mungo]|uniref:Uncharacterized protein n=1 Tax=Vigna mungo TaxID=3915 RepID=A0AAQ3NNW0_VIGMU